jgi:hypothetical protein
VSCVYIGLYIGHAKASDGSAAGREQTHCQLPPRKKGGKVSGRRSGVVSTIVKKVAAMMAEHAYQTSLRSIGAQVTRKAAMARIVAKLERKEGWPR